MKATRSSARKVTPEAPQSPTSIDAVLRNGDSLIHATSFLRDGVVAAIPAGAQNVQLVSFRQQATAGFDVSLSQINEAPSLRLVLSGTGNDGTHDFDLAYGAVFPSAGADEGWEDISEISAALNSGAIRTAGGKSLVDFGLVFERTWLLAHRQRIGWRLFDRHANQLWRRQRGGAADGCRHRLGYSHFHP